MQHTVKGLQFPVLKRVECPWSQVKMWYLDLTLEWLRLSTQHIFKIFTPVVPSISWHPPPLTMRKKIAPVPPTPLIVHRLLKSFSLPCFYICILKRFQFNFIWPIVSGSNRFETTPPCCNPVPPWGGPSHYCGTTTLVQCNGALPSSVC